MASPRRSTRRSPRSSARPASGSATPMTRCWSRCAPEPGSRCRGCSTRSSTSGSTTSRSPASPKAPASERFAWDSYRRFVQMFGNVVRGIPSSALRASPGGGEATEPGRRAPTLSSTPRRLRELTATFKRVFEEATGEPFPTEPREQLRQAIDGGVRLLGRRAGGRLPAHQRHPRRLGHRGQRAADGLRQPRRRPRARASPSAATSGPASRPPPATSSPTPRARTSSPAPATPRTSRRWPTGCPRHTPSCSRPRASSSPTTRTCRTSSSRSRRVVSSCCRPAPPSAPPRPLSASPSTPCARAC